VRYADPLAQKEIDRLRQQLELANADWEYVCGRLAECRWSRDSILRQLERLEAKLEEES